MTLILGVKMRPRTSEAKTKSATLVVGGSRVGGAM